MKALADEQSCIIQITADAISAAAIDPWINASQAGGICMFAGTTRAERSADGRDLLALDYEAYVELATKQLHDLAERTRARWPVLKLAILHRVGLVAVGQPSVMIGVATPHRADAFEACRFVIDELKKDVAIWKKEVWAGGAETWVDPK